MPQQSQSGAKSPEASWRVFSTCWSCFSTSVLFVCSTCWKGRTWCLMLVKNSTISSNNINMDRHIHQQEAKALLSPWASLYIDHPLEVMSQSGEDLFPHLVLSEISLAWILNIQFKEDICLTFTWFSLNLNRVSCKLSQKNTLHFPPFSLRVEIPLCMRKKDEV